MVLGGYLVEGKFSYGIIVLRGSCPRGSCPRGSCPVTLRVRILSVAQELNIKIFGVPAPRAGGRQVLLVRP